MNFNRNVSTGIVLLDLERAFDVVWHDGLIHKLIANNYPIPLIKLLSSYLKDRTAYVEIKGSRSHTFQVQAGVPQGSILAPHLFNVFVNDIPIPPNCELAMYADDTALIHEVPSRDHITVSKILTQAVKSTQKFFNSWKIRLNTNKTEFMVFSKSRNMHRDLPSVRPKIRNQSFEWKDSVRYLGFELDKRLLFKTHIDKVIIKADGLVRTLYPIMKRKSKVPLKTKISVYRAIIRPVMTYACQVFNNCAPTSLNRIQIKQNKILRMIFDADWFTTNKSLHKRANIPTVRDYVDKLTRKFYEEAELHDNHLINNIGRYNRDSLGFRVKHRLPRAI